MAATKTWNCNDYFSVDKLMEWPEPESVSLMEVLAREDIDEAVHAILFRENYIVKRMDTYIQHQAVFKERRKEMLHKKWVENVARPLQQRIIEKVVSHRRPGQSQVKYEYCAKHMDKPTKASPMCECLFRRQQELREAKGTRYQHRTGKQNDMQKEPKGTKKAPLFSKSPKFMLTSHGIVPKERQRASAQPVWNKPSLCSSEKLVCTSKSHLPQEEKTCNISQIVFERQFRSSKLSLKKKEAEKKGLNSEQNLAEPSPARKRGKWRQWGRSSPAVIWWVAWRSVPLPCWALSEETQCRWVQNTSADPSLQGFRDPTTETTLLGSSRQPPFSGATCCGKKGDDRRAPGEAPGLPAGGSQVGPPVGIELPAFTLHRHLRH
ncbi:protein FAM228A-like [Microtus oregoni]|uniref:protein FAM228A-like n=1 Tax=Microtus oregoni TaxID=111838 RepID=UPI001BB22ABE|nr:protein FAM228A-like [Microtus oregoni]